MTYELLSGMSLVELNSPNAVHLSLRQTYRGWYDDLRWRELGEDVAQQTMWFVSFKLSSTVR
jgi:hypothetical protein